MASDWEILVLQAPFVDLARCSGAMACARTNGRRLTTRRPVSIAPPGLRFHARYPALAAPASPAGGLRAGLSTTAAPRLIRVATKRALQMQGEEWSASSGGRAQSNWRWKKRTPA